MIVVSDSGSLISLAGIGRLDLLRDLYGRVVVPVAVRDEISERGRWRVGAEEVLAADWIVPVDQVVSPVLDGLQMRFGAGESEAIALCLSNPDSVLLIDDHPARVEAIRRGVRIVGTLGVLIEAKSGGLISAVRPLVDGMIVATDFRVGQTLLDEVLRAVGEAD